MVLDKRLGGAVVHDYDNNDGNQYAWASTFPGKNGKLAFSSDRAGHEQIFTMNPDGTNETNISNNEFSDQWPNWSPNGTKIAFDTSRGGNREIFVMNANGTNPINISRNAADDVNPNWSPNSTKIVFSNSRAGNFEIYVVNANGTNPIRLTNNTAQEYSPNFGPVCDKNCKNMIPSFTNHILGNMPTK